MRRGVVLVAAVLVAGLPYLLLDGWTQPSAVTAGALVLAGLGGLVAAESLRILWSVHGDARLLWVAVGFCVVPLLTALRALTTAPGGGADAAVELVQWLAPPVLALTGGLAGRGLRAAAVPAGGLAVAALALALRPSLADGLVTGGRAEPALAALELGLAAVATVAVLLWVRSSPDQGTGPHGWVAAGLVVTVVAAAARSATESRTGTSWEVLQLASTLAVLVPAAGLSLSSCRPYRRQTRRWRQLEAQVRGLRASSPLLPGPSITPEDEEGLPSEVEVRALLETRAARIALQPVVALADGRVVGHEALARFGGRVSTDRWFRGAGLHGLSEQLELLTLRAALRLLPRLPEDVSLAVNLSPLALAHEQVHAELRLHDLSRIVVEITEHEAVRDYAAARAHLQDLRAAGARVAVDDIGAGFASLHHALLLRPDIVKLDQSLTRGIDHDARQRALVVALTRFAAEVGVELVAEGVETAEQATALQSLGLVVGQGWGLGVPVLQAAEDDEPGAQH
ncbi:MAG TPA: EAL domain-containing protein [Mycobacteriales bacterium]|nr:EAL domain-containing protein [Mycobacteriales bacterium]